MFKSTGCWWWLTVSFWLVGAAPMLRAANFFQGVAPGTVPWPGGVVPYRFDTHYSVTGAESNAIIAGLREWELAANVKFVPYVSQSNFVLLQFTNDGSGTGYYLAGSATTNGVMMLHGLARGLMCHEAGHLLGLQHEHQRIDRNSFIEVNPGNVFGGTNGEGLGAFLIDSNSTAFGNYDFESVMHYAANAFTNGLGDSLDPLPPFEKFYHKLGNLALSLGDRAAAVHLYGPPTIPLTNLVTTTADGGAGSLRAAIYYANDHPGTTIRFNLSTSDPNYHNGVYGIHLLGELPPLVSAGTVVDGTTQPGYAGKPLVVLDGSQVPPEAGEVSGLHLYGTNGVVRALAVDSFSYAGIQLFCSDATSNRVEGCYAGLQGDGVTPAPNEFAGIIFQYGAHDNLIGGLNATQRNVVSGSVYYGILINDTNSDGNVIEGNYIGTDATGSVAVPNQYSGVGVYYDQNHTLIGGTDAGAGNVISGNGQYGIYVDGFNNRDVVIQGNRLGTDATGTYAISNTIGGVLVTAGAHGVVIGGSTAGAGNVVSGNGVVGIYLNGPAGSSNVVQGNLVGLNAAGTAAVGNLNGIYLVNGVSSTTVGGTNAAARNVISGNLDYGIFVSDAGTTNNVIEGNYIGADVSGSRALGNGSATYGGIGIGIWSQANGNFVGGPTPGAGNLISGQITYGVAVGGADDNVIAGNLLGTDATGTLALANDTGVAVFGGATGTLVGGTAAGSANVISGNATYGLFISDAGTTSNSVAGNLIGTDLSGKHALANGFAGAAIFGSAANNLFGGSAAGAGNVISGNGTYGVFLSDAGTAANRVQGNLIGTDVTGAAPLGNGGETSYGANVELQQGASGNFIGDIAAGAGNVIAFSASGPGVLLYDAGTTNNAIRGNAIYGNSALGIDLAGDGVTLNHRGVVAGPDDLQNYPLLLSAVVQGGNTTVYGKLNGLPGMTYQVDLYRNPGADASGHGQGQFYTGTVSVQTDAAGNGAFAVALNGDLTGQYLSATAVAPGGDTSEFSADTAGTATPITSQFTGAFTGPTATGFQAQAFLNSGQSYRVQASTNLADAAGWLDLTNFSAGTGLLMFTDGGATNLPARFYRLVSP
jgi:hypothetical protein